MKRLLLLTFYFLVGFCIGFFGTLICRADASPAIEQIIIQEANAVGFDPALALAVAHVESSMNPNAIGAQGEVGLFQLHPRYFKNAPVEPRANAKKGIDHLLYWQKRCPHKVNKQFVICYNSGRRFLRSPKRAPYLRKVEKAYSAFSSRIAGGTQTPAPSLLVGSK
jgi:hypothetical protein